MSTGDDAASERAEIRGLLATNIRALHRRVERARGTDLSPEQEQLQLDRLRTLGALSRQYRLLARDADLDEMESEVELLKNAQALQKKTR